MKQTHKQNASCNIYVSLPFWPRATFIFVLPSIHPQSPPKECVECGCAWVSSSLCGSHKARGVWVLLARPTGVWAWPEYLSIVTHLEIALSCASFIFRFARGGSRLLGSRLDVSRFSALVMVLVVLLGRFRFRHGRHPHAHGAAADLLPPS